MAYPSSGFTGYHSIMIGDKNTFNDWHLFSINRPFVAPPLPKTRYVDILGMSGSLDYTEAPNRIPKYADREGSWEFIMLNPGDVPEYSIADEGSYHYDWAARYSEIMAYLQGKWFDNVILEDDPLYSYKGRVWVNEYRSDPGWGRIVINYRFQPFKIRNTDYNTVIRIINKSEITNSDAITLGIESTIPSGCQPTPLHIICSNPSGSGSEVDCVDIQFENTELRISTYRRFFGGLSLDGNDYDKEIIVNEMLVSNLYGGPVRVRIGPYPLTYNAGGQSLPNVNYGPVKVEFWFEEAII